MDEREAHGRKRFDELAVKTKEHQIERVGAELRGMMPWLAADGWWIKRGTEPAKLMRELGKVKDGLYRWDRMKRKRLRTFIRESGYW